MGDFPAYRCLRAAGRPSDPADFRAWALDGIPPGRVETSLESPPRETDAR